MTERGGQEAQSPSQRLTGEASIPCVCEKKGEERERGGARNAQKTHAQDERMRDTQARQRQRGTKRAGKERRPSRGGGAPGARCEGEEVGKIEVAEATPCKPRTSPTHPAAKSPEKRARRGGNGEQKTPAEGCGLVGRK